MLLYSGGVRARGSDGISNPAARRSSAMLRPYSRCRSPKSPTSSLKGVSAPVSMLSRMLRDLSGEARKVRASSSSRSHWGLRTGMPALT